MIYIGTSGWHYPKAKEGAFSWDGLFYPPKQRGVKTPPELEYYSQFYSTAEVNLTFYQLPRLDMVQGWVRRTPKGFLFSVKLHQKFTHPSLYEATETAAGRTPTPLATADIEAFRMILDVLAEGGKLGALLIQFGFDLPPTAFNIETVMALARAFEPHPVALEVRSRGWRSAPHIVAELRASNVAWVYVDQYTLHYPSIRDVAPTADFYYLRLHGRNEKWVKAKSGGERYNYLYSREELGPIAARIRGAASTVNRVFVYFNNHAAGKAPVNATMFQSLLDQLPPAEHTDALRARYPELADLSMRHGVAFKPTSDVIVRGGVPPTPPPGPPHRG